MVPPLEVQTSFGWRLGCGVALVACFTLPLLASAVYALADGNFAGAGRALTQLRGVKRIHQTRRATTFLYQVQLDFNGAKAIIYPRAVVNMTEVIAVVEALESGTNPWSFAPHTRPPLRAS
jgi:hypothetical protein